LGGGKMKSSIFKPLLAPNEQIDLAILQYPLLGSRKLDGIRCIFKDGEMITRNLKHFPNIKLRQNFEPLKKYSYDNNIILDGELLAESLTFNELSGLCRQLDKELPKDLYFYCFDMIKDSMFNIPFNVRTKELQNMFFKGNFASYPMKVLEQRLYKTMEEIEIDFKITIENGNCDGLILRNPSSKYKFGRATLKENIIYKLKQYQTFDAQIYGIVQATKVRDGVETTINELGRSVTSKKQADRRLIEKASAFEVLYTNGQVLKVTLAMTDEEKEEIWKNQKSYLGKTIEYKGMLIGAKDLPRHPVFLRYRNDKD
jgi:DNA ligase 1